MAEAGSEIEEKLSDETYDYVAYSKVGNVYDFTRLRETTPSSPHGKELTLRALSQKTLLEVQTPLGSTFYHRLTEGLGSKIVEAQFKLSKMRTANPPFFVRLLTAEEKRNLEAQGFQTVNTSSLLPEQKPLAMAA